MRRWKLTQAGLRAVEKDFAESKKTDKIYFDDTFRGLGYRCRRGGSRTWWLVCERDGTQHKEKLGPGSLTPDQARANARDKLSEIWRGIDLKGNKAEERAKAKETLISIIEQYLNVKGRELRPSSLTETKRYLLGTEEVKYFRDLHKIPIHKITQRNVATILTNIEATAPIAAKRARSVLSTVFRFAMEQGIVEDNPVSRTRKAKARPPRSRVLSNEELAAIWHACRDDFHGCIVKLLILTGQRRDEVGGMVWSELDHDSGTWTIPPARTKNKQEHTITLPGLAWSIIDSVPRRPDTDLLFGRGSQGYANWTIGKRSLDQRSGVSGWRIHDLRRTVATRMANSKPKGLGIRPHIVEAVLNHRSGHKAGIAGVYNWADYEPEIKTALAMWADSIGALVEDKERKILTFSPVSREERQ